jgi:thiamine-phosphate pyrophosphorylase
VKPVICMITDRHRLGPGGDAALVRRVAAAARAGVHLVQLRERDLEGRALTALASACVDAVRGTAARVVVNDRLDVALAAGAHGVHLRSDSMAAARVRRIAPAGFLIGRSIHSVQEARDAAGEAAVDYLIFGTVFATASKPEAAPAGLDALADAAAATTIPVVAVGGVTAGTAGLLARTGAAGIAAIGLFMDPQDDDLPAVVRAIAESGFSRTSGNPVFDTPERVP